VSDKIFAYRVSPDNVQALRFKFEISKTNDIAGMFVVEIPNSRLGFLIMDEKALRENFKFDEEMFKSSMIHLIPREIDEYLEIRKS